MEHTRTITKPEILSFIGRTPIFTGVGLTEQKILAEHFVIENHGPEKIVIEQGDIGDKLYIIVHGTVAVSIRTPLLEWKRINILRERDVFGEIAILRNVPRTARITTMTPCQFITINAAEFLAVYQYFTRQARDNIQLVIAKRLQEQEDFKRN